MQTENFKEPWRFVATLSSIGRIRPPDWLWPCGFAVKVAEHEIIMQFRKVEIPVQNARTFSFCGAWLGDVFPQESTGRGGRQTGGRRAMSLLFTKTEAGVWEARIPRDLSWYEQYRTVTSRRLDEDKA